MKIVVVHTEPPALESWIQSLRRLLPDARVAAAGDPDAVGADYAVGWGPPPDFFAAQPRLKAFVSAAAGVDFLFAHPGLPPALPIVRLEDAGMGRQMVAYCRHELLRIAGRWDEYRALQAARRWQELEPLARDDLPVGVLGMGVLGGQVARALSSDGWRVAGYSRGPRTVDGVQVFHGADGWHDFLAASRLLIVLAPLTADTADLVDANALARLRPSGWVINAARGGLLVDRDLIDALDAGHLAGATLDVFRQEPLPADHPFWSHPRIRITPHIAAITRVDESVAQVADKLQRLERGERPGGWVDRARGY